MWVTHNVDLVYNWQSRVEEQGTILTLQLDQDLDLQEWWYQQEEVGLRCLSNHYRSLGFHPRKGCNAVGGWPKSNCFENRPTSRCLLESA